MVFWSFYFLTGQKAKISDFCLNKYQQWVISILSLIESFFLIVISVGLGEIVIQQRELLQGPPFPLLSHFLLNKLSLLDVSRTVYEDDCSAPISVWFIYIEVKKRKRKRKKAKSIYCGSMFDFLECFTGLECLNCPNMFSIKYSISYSHTEFNTIFDNSYCVCHMRYLIYYI